MVGSPVLELLATLPVPEEVLALRASLEWERIEHAEHLVRVAKAKAAMKLKAK